MFKDSTSGRRADHATGRPLRIALYHPRAAVGDGGITRSVRNLAREFVALGVEARVIFDDNETERPDIPGDWIGVRHRNIGSLHIPIDAKLALRDVDVVVLHSGWTPHNYLFARAAVKSDVPVVLAPRGAYDPKIVARRALVKRVWYALFERRLLLTAAGVHAFFPSQTSHAEALGFDGPAVIAPNGVSVPDPASWDGGTSGEIAYIGRFDPEHKGLDLLVDAVEALDPTDRPKLAMYGPDWQGGKQRIVKKVETADLSRWISVRPAVYGDEKWAIMRSARGFVYPSRWEAFGNAPAEAAAIGVPTLVTGYPLGQHLAKRDAAILVEADVDSIAEGLRALGAPEAAVIGLNASEAMKDFTWNSVARQWIEQLEPIAKHSVT